MVRARAGETLHGGALVGVLAAARSAMGGPVRLGAAPSRFAALAAASRARARRAEVMPLAAAALAGAMAPLPVSLLRAREETAHLPDALERFGIRTLGELAKLPRGSLADRFGPPVRSPATSRKGRTRRWSPGRRPSGWRSGWSCPSRRRARSSTTASRC